MPKENNMQKSWSRFCSALIAAAWIFLLFGTAKATGDHVSIKQLTETMAKIRSGKTPVARDEAAEHLAKLTRGINPNKVDDKTIADIASLLDGSADSVRYWLAASLGNLGPRARMAAPKLLEVLAEVDCLRGDKTSASGIRFALTQMGITPPPLPVCDNK
jgi:hypothetical protein